MVDRQPSSGTAGSRRPRAPRSRGEARGSDRPHMRPELESASDAHSAKREGATFLNPNPPLGGVDDREIFDRCGARATVVPGLKDVQPTSDGAA